MNIIVQQAIKRLTKILSIKTRLDENEVTNVHFGMDWGNESKILANLKKNLTTFNPLKNLVSALHWHIFLAVNRLFEFGLSPHYR